MADGDSPSPDEGLGLEAGGAASDHRRRLARAPDTCPAYRGGVAGLPARLWAVRLPCGAVLPCEPWIIYRPGAAPVLELVVGALGS